MNGLLALWHVAYGVAWIVQIASFALMVTVDVKRTAHKRNPWKPRPSLRARWAYHYALPVYLVSSWVNILGDGFSGWDVLWVIMVTFYWWIMKKEDDWSDDDRDSVARGIRGYVERFGNRLRVVAPAPSS